MNFIGKSTSGVLDYETQGKQIINGVTGESVVLKAFTRLQDMTSSQYALPVVSQLAQAKFVNQEGGKKPVSYAQWGKEMINAEEVAVIIPISEQIVADTTYDIFGQIKGQVSEAFGLAIDNAVMYGVDKPASWGNGIIPTAIAKHKGVKTTADLYQDIMGENGLISQVEESGYFVDGFYSIIGMRGKLRGLRGTDGHPIFLQDMKGSSSPYALDGSPVYFNRNGAKLGTADTKELMVAGDFAQAVYSIRQDISWSIHDSGVLTDAEGKVVLNALDQDLLFLRFVMRLGWALPNPANRVDSGTDRYPFAVLSTDDVPSA